MARSDKTVCLDLGSTVLKAALIGENRVENTAEAANPQARICPDVIGRTRKPNLRPPTVDAVNALIARLSPQPVERLIVTGNTVMLHILLGVDPSGMAEYPYTPAFTARQTRSGKQAGIAAARVETLPCASAFIGADVVAGYAAVCGDPADRTLLYIDLGTNGEAVLARGGQRYALSTAAGSALGPHASQGIESVAERLKSGALSARGDRTTRALQLAKAAVAAGVYTLLDRAAVSARDVDGVYAAGGLRLRAGTAHGIGLLPRGLPEPQYVGNASLAGAVRYATDPDFAKTVERVADSTVTVLPSLDPTFENLLIRCMPLGAV